MAHRKPPDRDLSLGPRLGLRFGAAACAVAIVLGSAPQAWADRSHLKPPWNIFSPEVDIKVGRQNAQIIEKRLPLCNDPKVDAYLTQLGLKLAARLPTRGVQYPWEFHCVNTKDINAFALPGGFVFVNRGLIEAADNEGQLAAVMGHELSHVALRHGTAQASKGQLAQGAADIFRGIFGGSAGGSLLSQGVAAGAMGVLLHYSRSDETQADVLGTQTIYDLGYDPRAMAQFFEKLEAESKGKNPPQFLSDHPNPGNRIARVDEEIDKLGGVPAGAKRDSPEFETIKREVLALPVVSNVPHPTNAANGPPPPPSRNLAEYRGKSFILRYPDNWEKYEDSNGVTFAPEGGIQQGSGGQGQIAYGFIVSTNQVNVDTGATNALETATEELIRSLQKSNPGIRVAGAGERMRLSGQLALSTHLVNDSPGGGKEGDWLVTVLQPGSLVSFLAVAPQGDFRQYEKTFAAMLDSVGFTD
jgi:beta-barrel assembly-enhancing protease